MIDVCLDLFFAFESNNMLHADVESMVVGILESGGPDLLTGLIKNARLLTRIIDAHAKNDEATATAKGNSLGYMGHLHRICNMILSLAEDVRGSTADSRSLNDMTHADSVLELLEEDQVLWSKWEELSSKVLAPIYERERLPLGGVSIASGNDDPYMGFNQSDELLNAQFAEMLGASGFGSTSNDFEHYFDLQTGGGDSDSHNDTPMLPEIMNDSSSSEDEDDDVRFGQTRDSDDGFDFDPRGVASAFPETSSAPVDGATPAAGDATDRWASFEASGSWAAFDDATPVATDFTATFDMAPMDESEIMAAASSSSSETESEASEAKAESVSESAPAPDAESETPAAVAATETATVTVTTTESTVTIETTETTTVETVAVDSSSVEVSIEAAAVVDSEAAAAEDAPATTTETEAATED